MHVPAQMDLIPPKEMMGRNVNKLEACIVGRVVPNGADVATDLCGQCPANAADVVVRIMVALETNDLALDLRQIEVRLVASGLSATVLAVVHEVTNMNKQIIRLAALVNSTDQSSIVLLHCFEWTVRPLDNARSFGALEVEVAGEEGLHCCLLG